MGDCIAISLKSWQDFLFTDNSNKDIITICECLKTFTEIECPNRENLQTFYYENLDKIEEILIKLDNSDLIIDDLATNPLIVSNMKDDPSTRLFTLLWNREKNISTKKQKLCGEDVEFQGGRKVQLQNIPNTDKIIEYNCTTPKKNQTVPWSRSILHIQGSRLWMVNYRPRRNRNTNNNASQLQLSTTRIRFNSKTKKSISPKKRTFSDPNSPGSPRKRQKVNSLDEEPYIPKTNTRNSKITVTRTRFHHRKSKDSKKTSIAARSCSVPSSNIDGEVSPNIIQEIPIIQPKPQFHFQSSNSQSIAKRSVSCPEHDKIIPLDNTYSTSIHEWKTFSWDSFNITNTKNQFNQSKLVSRSFTSPSHINTFQFPSEDLVVNLIQQLLDSTHNNYEYVTQLAKQTLSPLQYQRYDFVSKIIQKNNIKSVLSSFETQLLLHLGCKVSTIDSFDYACTTFKRLFEQMIQIHYNFDDLYNNKFFFAKKKVIEHQQIKTVYVYLSSRAETLFENLKINTKCFLGKTDFDIFEESIGLSFLQEDMDAIELSLVMDNPLPLPCICDSTNCHIISSKICIPTKEGDFIFCCGTAIQCITNNLITNNI